MLSCWYNVRGLGQHTVKPGAALARSLCVAGACPQPKVLTPATESRPLPPSMMSLPGP